MKAKNNHGCKRANSGRKSDKEILNIRQKLDDNIDYNFVIERLKDLITNGDYRAIDLYMKYRWGTPVKSIEVYQESITDLNFELRDLLRFKEDK